MSCNNILNEGSAGSGGGAVIEATSVPNGPRGGDPFSAAGAGGPGITPHVAHFYGPSSMGVISPPSLDTLGLSSGSNILNNGANSGTSNGMYRNDNIFQRYLI